MASSLRRVFTLTAYWWLTLHHEAAAEKVPGMRGPRVLTPVVLQTDRESKPRKQRVMGAINQFRAQICNNMHAEHGEEFASFDECEEFMKKACHPGKDKKMDGDRKEVTSGKGYCEEYFPLAEKKGLEEVDEEDAKASDDQKKAAEKKENAEASKGDSEKVVEDSSKAATVGPAPAPASASTGDAKKKSGGAASASPAGAPAPAAATDGWSSWYYKDGGKSMKSRFHMDVTGKDGSTNKGLPAHGYWGKLVGHKDMETGLDDWRQEIGGDSYSKAWADVCAKHPNSPWCSAHSRHGHHSSSPTSTHFSAWLLLLTMTTLVFH